MVRARERLKRAIKGYAKNDGGGNGQDTQLNGYSCGFTI